MTTVQEPPLTLGDSSARQLANATKTTAQMTTITPRWLVHLAPSGGQGFYFTGWRRIWRAGPVAAGPV